jgi:HD-GYP domain-containing protein (c-di-GMP phosphodiesterase class II)
LTLPLGKSCISPDRIERSLYSETPEKGIGACGGHRSGNGIARREVKGIRIAGMIHDIGKLFVPAEIVAKPGALTPFGFSILKEHPQKGYEILKEVKFLWPVAGIVPQHHERLDGSGYPRKLKGNEIQLEARVLAVADVIGAISSRRTHSPAFGIDAAL